MKKLFSILIYLLIIGLVIFTFEPITNRLALLLQHKPRVATFPANNYFHEHSFRFVRQSEDFIPYSKQDLKNIFYSFLNKGWERFTFYCPREYTNCISDVQALIAHDETLTHINNFVHPFNAFRYLTVITSEAGEVTIEVERLYSAEDISKINQRVDEIITNLINNEMDEEEKILAIHDYILENAFYDLTWSPEDNPSIFRSNMAYGPLFQGFAICSGFTDAMAIFLTRFNIPNFKIASTDHVWNAVLIDGEWLHLDLTWNSPVDENNPYETNLIHKFFLITTEVLIEHEITNHDFNPLIYQELKV